MSANLLIGISVGLGTLVVLLVLLVVWLRRELAVAHDRAEEERRRSRILDDLLGALDLDEVLARVLAAAEQLSGVDAALVLVPDPPADKPVVATRGLSAEEVESGALAAPPDGRLAGPIRLSCTSSSVERERESNADVLAGGLAVPLSGESPTGYLAVFTRSPDHAFDEEDVRELEALAAKAAPVIENARRFREARQLADLDALTGLHNRRFFHETLAREVARARRYERALALIVLDLDDFKEINDRIGHLAGDEVLAEAAERVREVVRSADIACRVGGDEFAVILPESTPDDADQLYRRIQHNVSARPIAQAGRLYLSAGIADLSADDDAATLFRRADEALYRAKDAGKRRAVAAASPRRPA